MAGLTLAGNLSAQTAAAPPVDRPNIVVIVAADMGYGDLSCYDATRIHTPNVDRLAVGEYRDRWPSVREIDNIFCPTPAAQRQA